MNQDAAMALAQLQEIAKQLGYDRAVLHRGSKRWFLERDVPWKPGFLESVALDAFYGAMKAELISIKLSTRT